MIHSSGQRRKWLLLAWIALVALPFIGFQLLQSRELPRELDAQIRRGPNAPQAFPIAVVVNSTGDGHDAVPGDGVCETAPGNNVCTLRAAIEEVNAEPSTNDYAIIFSIPTTDPGYNGTSWTITLTAVLQDLIQRNIAINGPGADKLTITRPNSAGGFRIFNVTTTGTVTFSGLTISNGNQVGDGGGIQNAGTGTVNVTSCTLSNNTALDGGGISNSSTGQVHVITSTLSANTANHINGNGLGGGIYNPSSGTVTVANSTFSGNRAQSPTTNSQNYGGGIYNNGTLTVTNSTFSTNTASGGFNTTKAGGGIYNDVNGIATIANSTVSGNAATNGGGISTFGTVNVINSTLSGNTADGGCGGIATGSGGALNLTNSTISNNTASPAGGGGGGVCGSGAGQIKSSIIALNTGPSSPDVAGTFTSAGFNLIGKNDGAATSFPVGNPNANNDIVGTSASPIDPKLDPTGLQNNGGPTKTIALLSGSPAIDKGTSIGLTGALIIDQRGVGYSRTVDDPSVPNAAGGDGTDVGAFEFGARISAFSRKTHGSAGVFGINLPLAGTRGVECRIGGVTQVVFTFPSAVTINTMAGTQGASVTSGTGSVTSTAGSGTMAVTVNLTGVTDIQYITLTLLGVNDGTNTNDVAVRIGVLLGDVNANGVLTNADVSLVKAEVAAGGSVGSSNFRDDINANGVLTNADVSLTKAQVAAGAQLPTPP